ncbi:protein CASP-like isoform X1 [Acropora millepora]|uniref:protein CASP-like isoform X1 n=1 Tax=Acropora millepora TaxID=45264 RepID=UPI0010FCAF72|nr:protein CASP-like isoform X1 [Acropora millepora]
MAAAASSFVSMRNFWKDFSLPELQKSLDVTATELADRQDESDTSRKKLVELSRDFKKNTPEDTRKKVAPLLKSFQAEIDALSKRSKASETAFLSIYKKLVDVPDPLPILEQSVIQQQKVSKLQDYEIENKQLRETLEEYNSEFAEVKNQEVTINRLKEKLREYEDKMEERVQGRVREKEKDMQKVFSDKENALQEKQVSVAKKLGEAEHKAATLQAALDSTQSELFDVKAKFDEMAAARSTEIEILEADVERANQRASSAERQVESLREELLAAQNAAQNANDGVRPNMLETIDAISRASLEQELAAKERQISQLVTDVQQLQVTQGKAKELATSEISRLEDLLASKTTALRELESKLEEQNNYEEIKRELSILKSVEFSTSETERDEIKPESSPKSLEMLLLDKNKRLQSENTSLKVENVDLTGRYTELHSKYNEAVNTVKEQKELIGQLETDLLSVNALPSAFRGQGEGEAGPPTEKELVSNAVQQAVASGTGGLTGDNVESLLPIVASQRERFKVRNMELEAQLRHNQQQITVLQNEVDTLRSDNVKLYEKIKFLQSYPTKGQGGRDDDSAVSRYSSQYEQRLDPFSAFNQREKQQRYLGLSPHEKVTLNLGKFIMSNKVARTIAFFYTLLVHLMVFLVLYKLAYTESCKRDVATECARRFAEHMHEVHGQ